METGCCRGEGWERKWLSAYAKSSGECRVVVRCTREKQGVGLSQGIMWRRVV